MRPPLRLVRRFHPFFLSMLPLSLLLRSQFLNKRLPKRNDIKLIRFFLSLSPGHVCLSAFSFCQSQPPQKDETRLPRWSLTAGRTRTTTLIRSTMSQSRPGHLQDLTKKTALSIEPKVAHLLPQLHQHQTNGREKEWPNHLPSVPAPSAAALRIPTRKHRLRNLRNN